MKVFYGMHQEQPAATLWYISPPNSLILGLPVDNIHWVGPRSHYWGTNYCHLTTHTSINTNLPHFQHNFSLSELDSCQKRCSSVGISCLLRADAGARGFGGARSAPKPHTPAPASVLTPGWARHIYPRLGG